MEIRTVKCPTCGANVEVDEFSNSFTCKFCGASSVIEKEDKSWEEESNDESYKKAELLIRDAQDYKKARDQYEDIIRRNPADPRGQWGVVRCLTKDFTEKLYINVDNYHPEWFTALDEQLKKYFQAYLNVEKKEEAKQANKAKFDEYYQINQTEFENLKSKVGNQDNNTNTEENEIEKKTSPVNEFMPLIILVAVLAIIVIYAFVNAS